MKYDFLICVALPSESGGRFETLGFPVIYTGIGKLNAAISLHRELSHYHQRKIYPKAIVNLGTVGSGSLEAFSVVQINRFIQRDMLCEPLAPRYYTPFDTEGQGGPIDLRIYSDILPRVSCGTGDSFVSTDILKMQKFFLTGPNPGYEVVDMEGFALAKGMSSVWSTFCFFKMRI